MKPGVIELRPYQVEAILNKMDAPRVRVFERVISPELKVKNAENGEMLADCGISAAEVLRDSKGIVARALARGAAKILPARNANNTRNYAHKTERRWTKKQRAARSETMRAETKSFASTYYAAKAARNDHSQPTTSQPS